MAATTTFTKGQKVRTNRGLARTVLFQKSSLMVFVEEECNTWYHPSNLRLIPDAEKDQT
jgi:hypothetical protein